MRQKQTVRVIKREQRAAGGEGAPRAAGADGARARERELRAVVSGWIREHRLQSEASRRAVARFQLC